VDAIYVAETGFGSTSASVTGDVNGDQKLDVRDATLALRIAVGLEPGSAPQRQAADMNSDGKLNIQDAILMLRKIAHLD
jgi:hypothetical protein